MEFQEVGVSGLIVHCPPGLEPFLPCSEGTNPGIEAVGDHQELIQGKQRRKLRLVGLQLLPGLPNVGILIGRILEFDDPQGQPVQEQDDVRPSGGLVLLYRELVNRQPVVVSYVLEVDDVGRFARHYSVRPSDRDGYSVNQHAVERAIPGFQGWTLGVNEILETGFKRRSRQARVEVQERFSQTFLKHHLGKFSTFRFGSIGCDIGPVCNLPSQAGEPG